jgi:uncharacterized protein (TIGR00255 family)
MIKSMTGFASKEMNISSVGKVSLEIRSTNHKFLEVVIHLPQGISFLEDKIKGEIESKIKRGRVVCSVNIVGSPSREVFINYALINKYILAGRKIKEQYRIEDGLSLDTLINLPGVLDLEEGSIPKAKVWASLKGLTSRAVGDLTLVRGKEGRALYAYLKTRGEALKLEFSRVRQRFLKVIKERSSGIKNEEELSSFLKQSDITEEMDRIEFHIVNFLDRLSSKEPVGKELDFIAQEMQREANTMGAKCCDADISAKVVKIKSEIEKIREQIQNIE